MHDQLFRAYFNRKSSTNVWLALLVCAVICAIVVGRPLSARAAVIAFDDRTAWLAAAGPLSATEDFQSFAVDTPFRNNSFVLLSGGMSIGEIGPASQSNENFIDVSPFSFGSVNSTPDAAIGVDSTGTPANDTQVELRFSTPATGWGADFVGAAGGDIAALDIISTTNNTLATISVTQNNQFLGFTTTAGEKIGKLLFHGLITGGPGVREGFLIDDVGVTLVPEPESLALAMGAMAAAGAIVRRRKLV